MPAQLSAVAPLEAIKALEARGRRLAPSFAWQEVYADAHGAAFTVAKSAGFDILKDIYAGLEAALKEGKTYQQFAAELTPLLQQKGWWGQQVVTNPNTGTPVVAQLGSPRRLRLIFDVNMRVSYAAGHWASFERNKASRPFLRYVAIMDEHTRPTHALHHNVTLPVDHPHWRIWAPPCGWNCRCTLQSLSQRDVDRMRAELKLEPPTIETAPWANKVTGEVRHIPKGIDPGWDYNPGRAGYLAALNDSATVAVATAPAILRPAGVSARVTSPDLGAFIRSPQGSMPVAVLPPELAGPIGAGEGVSVIALPARAARAIVRQQPNLTTMDFVALQAMVNNATVVVQDGSRTIYLLHRIAGTWWQAIVRATPSGDGLTLLGYQRQTADRIQELLAVEGAKVLLDRR